MFCFHYPASCMLLGVLFSLDLPAASGPAQGSLWEASAQWREGGSTVEGGREEAQWREGGKKHSGMVNELPPNSALLSIDLFTHNQHPLHT